ELGALAQHSASARLPQRPTAHRVRSHLLRYETDRPTPGRNPIARASTGTTAISKLSKRSPGLGDLKARVTQLAADRNELEAAEESAERSAQFAAKMGNSASSTDEPVDVDTKTAPGREVAPLVISKLAV